MEDVTIQGLTFVPYLKEEEILKQVKRVASEIRRDLEPGDAPIFLCVLNGAFVFAADVFREVDVPESEITFIRFKSYEGTQSTGVVKQVMGLTESLEGRTVIIIEDIVDTGVTAQQLRATLKEQNPKSVKMATLLFKPDALQCDLEPDYVGLTIPSAFIVGHGLDYDEQGRAFRDIYQLVQED